MEDRRESFDLLERARRLAPRIQAAQDEIDRACELPADLARDMGSAGLFRLLLPESLGGPELGVPAFVRVMETIGEADGSAGWCVSQASVYTNCSHRMNETLAEAIWGTNLDCAVATGVPVGSRAEETADGYRLSGRWRFASGCLHADWVAAAAPVVDMHGEAKAQMQFLIPRSEANIVDAWNVRGMRGTGSHDYIFENHEVPKTHCILSSDFSNAPGVSSGMPGQVMFATGFGSLGVGIARRAIDSLIELAQGKTAAFANARLREDEHVQIEIARAEAAWRSTRAFLLDMAEEAAHAWLDRDPLPLEIRARMRLAATHAMRQSGTIVDTVYALAGTDGIFDDHPMHRCFQDIHALTQQVQGRVAHYKTVGRVLLGLEPDSHFV